MCIFNFLKRILNAHLCLHEKKTCKYNKNNIFFKYLIYIQTYLYNINQTNLYFIVRDRQLLYGFVYSIVEIVILIANVSSDFLISSCSHVIAIYI